LVVLNWRTSLNANPVLKSEFLQVAHQLFQRFRQPMTPIELVDRGIQEGLFSDKRAGKTPHQTMKSKLSVHIRRNGSASIFVRTAPGRYYLRELRSAQKKLPLFDVIDSALPQFMTQSRFMYRRRMSMSLSSPPRCSIVWGDSKGFVDLVTG